MQAYCAEASSVERPAPTLAAYVLARLGAEWCRDDAVEPVYRPLKALSLGRLRRADFAGADLTRVRLTGCRLVVVVVVTSFNTIPYDTRCCFNVRLKADNSQLNLPHGTVLNRKKTKKKKMDMLRSNSKQSGWGIHVVSPEEEKERLRWEGFVEKKALSLE